MFINIFTFLPIKKKPEYFIIKLSFDLFYCVF